MSYRSLRRTTFLALAICVAAVAVAGYSITRSGKLVASERDARKAEVAGLRTQVQALQGRNAALSGRVSTAVQRLHRKEAGIAPLASRVLRSVFTVRTPYGLGSGFVAWRDGSDSYVITAYHVVAQLIGSHVTLSRKGGNWGGELTGIDPRRDLALIRVDGKPAGAEPLWQKPDTTPPRTGDELLLLGSPYGLQGTVTTGIVSRVTKKYIQTDAAANPGNSGGPAIDKQGRVVGVLVAGGGENINFAVPIKQVCSYLRNC
jgi:S1-C subfamily serine protease